MSKISALPLTGPLTGDETLPVVQNGVTKRLPLGAFLEETISETTSAAAQSAAYAGGFEAPEYATQSAGNAATTPGQIFRVPLGTAPQTFNWYRRLSSGSELVDPLATSAALAAPAGASRVGSAPAIGSPLVFGTVDAKTRENIDLTAAPFNMRPGADADQSGKLTDAIDAWQASGGERRTIRLPAGKLKWETTANACGVNSGYFADLIGGDNRQLTIEGAGRDQTILVGGEPGFGFLEVTDSCAMKIRDFAIDAPNAGAAQVAYGIIGGRTAGDASSGFIEIENVGMRGRFTKWPMFFLSIEQSQFIRPFIWSILGNGLALAMNNADHSVTPKHLPFGAGLGGNGVNYLISPWMASLNLALPESRLLLSEFSQALSVHNAYFVSSHAKAHIRLAKRASMHLDGGQFEFDPFAGTLPGALDPISIEFADGTGEFSPTFDIPEYRNTRVTNSRLRSVFGENGSKVVGLSIDESNVLKSFHNGYAMNFDTLQDSRIAVSPRLNDASAVPSRTDIQIRTQNGGNTFGPGIARDKVVAPFPSLDSFTDVETGQLEGVTGLSTISGAAVAESGMFAFVAPPVSAGFSLLVDWTVPDLSGFDERCIIALGANPSSMGTIGTVSMALFAGQLLLRTFGDAGGQIDYRGTVDPAFVAKFRGKRVRMLLRRAAGATEPDLTIDGCEVLLGRTTGAGAGLWDKPVTGNILMVGYQSSTAANNCPAIYHSVALYNYALSDADASEVTRFGVRGKDRWGGAFGSGVNGCIGLWEMDAGTGSRVLEASATNLVTDGNIIGTTARLQNAVTPGYSTHAGSPIGARFPRCIGEECLNTVGNTWFKAFGLGINDWQAL